MPRYPKNSRLCRPPDVRAELLEFLLKDVQAEQITKFRRKKVEKNRNILEEQKLANIVSIG
jgi:hypothetical protein